MVAAEFTLPRRRRQARSTCAAIEGIISRTPDRASVISTIELSRQLALAYLIKKSHSGSLPVAAFGLDLEDLALDCIAELFERSDDGQFPVLQTYFGEYLAEDATEANVIVALRRLVFSKVNENLFRRYHETDANLSKIIRNLKDAAKLDESLCLLTRKGDRWLAVVLGDEEAMEARLNAPLAPPEILEAFFTRELHKHQRVRDLARRFVEFVDMYPHYASGYPLVSAAVILRSAYVRTGAAGIDQDIQSPLAHMDIEEAIETVTRQTLEEKKEAYVGRGKVGESVYIAYIRSIEAILSAQLLPNVAVESYQDILAKNLPDMDPEEYHTTHRNILEYLTKLTRHELYNYMQ